MLMHVNDRHPRSAGIGALQPAPSGVRPVVRSSAWRTNRAYAQGLANYAPKASWPKMAYSEHSALPVRTG